MLIYERYHFSELLPFVKVGREVQVTVRLLHGQNGYNRIIVLSDTCTAIIPLHLRIRQCYLMFK